MHVGVDFGTSRVKGSVITSDGRLVARWSQTYGDDFRNEAGHQYYDILYQAIGHLTSKAKCVGKVRSLAVTGTAPNVLVVPLDSLDTIAALMFFDADAYDVEVQLDSELNSPKWHNEVLSKLVKLRETARGGARWFSLHNYLVWRLTGAYLLDAVVASECGSLLDANLEWSSDISDRYNLGCFELPKICAPLDVAGDITDDAFRQLLGSGCVVAAGSSDSVGTSIGSGVIGDNDFLIYYGTFNSATRLLRPLRSVLTSATAMPVFDWFCSLPRSGKQLEMLARILYGSVDQIDDMLAEADGAPPGAGGVGFRHTVHRQVSTVSTDPVASIVGLGLGSDRASVARSFLESFGFAIVVGAEAEGVRLRGMIGRAAGGGARSETWRRIVSAVLDVPQSYVRDSEDALGAAILALGVTEGITDVLAVVDGLKRTAHMISPDEQLLQQYVLEMQRYRGTI